AATGGDPAQEAAFEPRIRSLGKEIVAIAEELAGAERRVVQSSLATFRRILVVAIGSLAAFIVLLGRALSRSVVSPLKEMETSVDAISRGKRDSLAMPSRDRELVSIGNAFNHMLRELDLRQRHLVQSEKLASLGTMLSGVAHELNNPLSNISSSCQILLEELEGTDVDTQKMFLGQIDGQTLRARNIVRSLLDFARDREFRKEALPLRELVEQTVGFVKGEVPAKAAIGIAIADDIIVFADKQRLQQALLNLLKNALEALGETGSVAVTAEKHFVSPGTEDGPAWAVGCGLEGEVVDIAVSDDGPGIAPEVLPRIFDPFFTTKDVGLGMGLGLFIVYEVVDEHGGWIAASSEPGKGTTFHIRLPQPNGWTG
ncbi:MAG: HAMP domain-containing histidine kinase, partial [Acetobacteraceae bacterium]|nr:HAMP domain-containing histidine kinase [Acetobacteraceae bacterium]